MRYVLHYIVLCSLLFVSYSTPVGSNPPAGVIVNKEAIKQGKVRDSMPVQELVDIFTKKKTVWGDRTEIILVTYPENSVPNKVFIQDMLGLTPYQYRSKMDRNVYKGRVTQSIVVNSEEQMVEYIMKNDRAIGYLFNYILYKENDRIIIIKIEN